MKGGKKHHQTTPRSHLLYRVLSVCEHFTMRVCFLSIPLNFLFLLISLNFKHSTKRRCSPQGAEFSPPSTHKLASSLERFQKALKSSKDWREAREG